VDTRDRGRLPRGGARAVDWKKKKMTMIGMRGGRGNGLEDRVLKGRKRREKKT